VGWTVTSMVGVRNAYRILMEKLLEKWRWENNTKTDDNN
jgi:hypothetical protein